MQGIYAITHIETGRFYIGSSVNIERRFKEHRIRLKNGTHPAKHLMAAFKKYGEAAFSFDILEEYEDLTDEKRIDRENVWIWLLKPIFNTAPVAGSIKGMKRSPEVRAKMAEAQKKRYAEQGNPIKGRPRTEEAKAAISAGKKGKKFADQHRENLRISRWGDRPKQEDTRTWTGIDRLSEEGRAKITCALKSRVVSSETKAKMSASAKARHQKARERIAQPGGQE